MTAAQHLPSIILLPPTAPAAGPTAQPVQCFGSEGALPVFFAAAAVRRSPARAHTTECANVRVGTYVLPGNIAHANPLVAQRIHGDTSAPGIIGFLLVYSRIADSSLFFEVSPAHF